VKHWFKGLKSSIFVAGWTVLLPLCVTATVWAQPPGAPEKPQASWVLSYVLVVFGVGFGLFAVCRSGRRQK
jgi:hypothetical protein